MLAGKKIVLGICGSIAAYKSALLTRLLVKAGAEVKVLMTKDALHFINPLTLSTLSKHKVDTDLITEEQWNSHVDLGLWADVFIIAPASANTIAKLANGFCDNLLTAACLSARCPVFIAPAMDTDMWKYPATKRNIKTLKEFGYNIIDVEKGELASGLIGEGRMAEPEHILTYLEKAIGQKSLKQRRLAGKTALVTAGPTHEAIDPVRFISNNSTGQMGASIAKALYDEGADVTLVAGPGSYFPENKSIRLVHVTTAKQMYNACLKHFKKADITVMAAAVADYTPVNVADKKIKKHSEALILELKPTKDILAELGKQKSKKQLLIGFSLETDNESKNALQKLHEKKLDAIVLNSLRDKGAGFGFNTNKISILDKKNKHTDFPLKPKSEVAKDIVEYIINKIHA
jgi:phosphopantothenoylcysteine decarboxylase / phosphopantothenate---cysteine ligase